MDRARWRLAPAPVLGKRLASLVVISFSIWERWLLISLIPATVTRWTLPAAASRDPRSVHRHLQTLAGPATVVADLDAQLPGGIPDRGALGADT